MKNFEQKLHTEKIAEVELLSIHLESDFASLDITEDKTGLVLVEFANGKGEKISLNSLLPEGYRITGNIFRRKREDERNVVEEEGTYGDIRKKEIVVSRLDAQREGQRYILTVLHEIGHAVRAAQNPEEIEELLSIYDNQAQIYDNKHLFERMHELTSRDERDAWAFALKKIRELTKKLGIPLDKVIGDVDTLKNFYRERLSTYKSSALSTTEHLNLSEEVKKDILDKISKLYSRNE